MSASGESVLAVVLAGAAAATWVGPGLPAQRVRLLGRLVALGQEDTSQVGSTGRPPRPGGADRFGPAVGRAAGWAGRDGSDRRPGGGVRGARAAAGLAALGVFVLVGGPAGVLLAVAVAVLGPRWLGRLEPAEARRRRLRAGRDLPVAADLLAACLAAGSPPEAALGAVATAVAGPVGTALDAVVVSLRLGADPRTAWQPYLRHPDLGPLARAVARALDTGAPLADGVGRCADDLRARRRSDAEQAARSVGVRAAAPLGLCFLPAFVLVGVVPTVVGLAAGLFG